jgi:hypothetical protein
MTKKPTNWDEAIHEATKATNDHFASKISSLTHLNDVEIVKLIADTGISKQDLGQVLKEVKDSTKNNEQKAIAIRNIDCSIDLLVAIADKFI